MKVCIVEASRKLGRYRVQHVLDRDYEVVGVCRERSVGRLDAFKADITDELLHLAPEMVGCQTPSALAPAGDK